MAYTLTRSNALDGKDNSMTFDMSYFEFRLAFGEWQGGVMIQNAFWNLNADEREFIKTGITPELWDATFGNAD